MRGRGHNPGDSLSGHLRFGFAAFLVAAGVSTPAASNVLTDLLSPSTAAQAAAPAPAPAPEGCLRQPGSGVAGQHWVYRLDGHRKCWFQASESSVASKSVRHDAARRRVAAPEETEPAPRGPEAVEDAHAELMNPAPAQPSQPTEPVPTIKILHTVPVGQTDAAGQVPPSSVGATPGVDQLSSGQPGPRQVDVDRLLADASVAGDEDASRHPATPVAAPFDGTDGGGDGTTHWLGGLLIALGFVALLGSSRGVQQALLAARFADAGTELPVIAQESLQESSQDGPNDPSPGRSASRRPKSGDALLRYDPQSLLPAARTRRPVAPGLASEEAI
jgi:hypothetical protein